MSRDTGEDGRRPAGTALQWRRLWSVAGTALAIAALIVLIVRTDVARLRQVLTMADLAFLAVLPAVAALEQLLRAWKWRQILHPLRVVATPRLFGAIMAGYMVNYLVPLGVSPLVRAWLVARLEAVSMPAVLATVAIDRFVDGVVFSGFVALVLMLSAFPDPDGRIGLGLVVGGVGSLAVFGLLLFILARFRRSAETGGGWFFRIAARLPSRLSGHLARFGGAFADGIVWPRASWRGLAIVLASIAIKLVAISYFVWAGLAFGVVLAPADYLFLLVFLGILIILTRLVRIPGGFLFGAVFALDLLGVAAEPALAMTAAVHLATVFAVAAIGAAALLRHGMTLDALRFARGRQRDDA